MKLRKLLRPIISTGFIAASPIITACKKTSTEQVNELLVLRSWNLNQEWATNIDAHNLLVETLNSLKSKVETASKTQQFVSYTAELVSAGRRSLSLMFPDAPSANLMELTLVKDPRYSSFDSDNPFDADFEVQSVDLVFRVKQVSLTKRLSWKVYKDGLGLVNNISVPPISYITREMHQKVVESLSALSLKYPDDAGTTNGTKELYDILKASVFPALQPIPEPVRVNLSRTVLPSLIGSDEELNDTNKIKVLTINFAIGNDGYGAKNFDFAWIVVGSNAELLDTWTYQPNGAVLATDQHAELINSLSAMKNTSDYVPTETFYTVMKEMLFDDMPPFPPTATIKLLEPQKVEPTAENVGPQSYVLKVDLAVGSGNQIVKREVLFKWDVVTSLEASVIAIQDSTIELSKERYDVFRSKFNSIINITTPSVIISGYTTVQNIEATKAMELFKLMNEYGFELIRLVNGVRMISNLAQLPQVTFTSTGVSFDMQLALGSAESRVASFYINVVVPPEGPFTWKNPINQLISIADHNKIADIVTKYRNQTYAPLNEFTEELKPFFPDVDNYSTDIKIVTLTPIAKQTNLSGDQELPISFTGTVTTGVKIYSISLSWRVMPALGPSSITWRAPTKIRHSLTTHNQLVADLNALTWVDADMGTIGVLTNEQRDRREEYLTKFYNFLVKYFRTVPRFSSVVMISTKAVFVNNATSDRIRTYSITFGLIGKLETNVVNSSAFTVQWETIYPDPTNPGVTTSSTIFEVPRARAIDLNTHNIVALKLNELTEGTTNYIGNIQTILIENIFPEMLAFPLNSSITFKSGVLTYTPTSRPDTPVSLYLTLQTADSTIIQLNFQWYVRFDYNEVIQHWLSFFANVNILYTDFALFRTSIRAVVAMSTISKIEKSNRISDLLRKSLNLDGVPLPPQMYISGPTYDAAFDRTSGTFVTKLGFVIKQVTNDASIINSVGGQPLFEISISVKGTPAEVLNPVESSINSWVTANEYVTWEKHNQFAGDLNTLIGQYGGVDNDYATKFWNLINEFFNNRLGGFVIGFKFTTTNFSSIVELPEQYTPYATQTISFTLQLGATTKNFSINYDVVYRDENGFFVPNRKTITYTTHLNIIKEIKQKLAASGTGSEKLAAAILVIKNNIYPALNLLFPQAGTLKAINNLAALEALNYLTIKNEVINLELLVTVGGLEKVVTFPYEVTVNSTEAYLAWVPVNSGTGIIQSKTYADVFRGEWNGLSGSSAANKTADTIAIINKYFQPGIMADFLNWGMKVVSTSTAPVIPAGASANYQQKISFTYSFADEAAAATKTLEIEFTVSFAGLVQLQTNFTNDLNSASNVNSPIMLNSYAAYKKFLEDLLPFQTAKNNDKIFEMLRKLNGLNLPAATEWTVVAANAITVDPIMTGVNVGYSYKFTLTYTFELVENTSIKVTGSVHVGAIITPAEILTLSRSPSYTTPPRSLTLEEALQLDDYLSGPNSGESFYTFINYLRGKVLNETVLTAPVNNANHDTMEPRTTALGPFFSMGTYGSQNPEFRKTSSTISRVEADYEGDVTATIVFRVLLGTSAETTVTMRVKILRVPGLSVKWDIPATANESITYLEWAAMQKELTYLLSLHSKTSTVSYITSGLSDRRMVAVISYYGYSDVTGLNAFNSKYRTESIVMQTQGAIAKITYTIWFADTNETKVVDFSWTINSNQTYAENKIALKRNLYYLTHRQYNILAASSNANTFRDNLSKIFHQHLEAAFYELTIDFSSIKFLKEENVSSGPNDARVSFKTTANTGIIFVINLRLRNDTDGYDNATAFISGLSYSRTTTKEAYNEIAQSINNVGKYADNWTNASNNGASFNSWEVSRILFDKLGKLALVPSWLTTGSTNPSEASYAYWYVFIQKLYYVNESETTKKINFELMFVKNANIVVGSTSAFVIEKREAVSITLTLVDTLVDYLNADQKNFGTGSGTREPNFATAKTEYNWYVGFYKSILTSSPSFVFTHGEIMGRLEALTFGVSAGYMHSFVKLNITKVDSDGDFRTKFVFTIIGAGTSLRKNITFTLSDVGYLDFVRQNVVDSFTYPTTSDYPVQNIGTLRYSGSLSWSKLEDEYRVVVKDGGETAVREFMKKVNTMSSSNKTIKHVGDGPTRKYVSLYMSNKHIQLQMNWSFTQPGGYVLKAEIYYYFNFS